MSKNGSEFAAFVEHTAVTYKAYKVLDYFSQDIPSELDNEIVETMRRFLSETPEHQQQFQEGMPKEARSLFGIFGHRAATIAARNEDLEMLKLGLVATAVSNYEIPEKRRVEVGLSIFYHVARKLEQNPIDLFEDVAQIAVFYRNS